MKVERGMPPSPGPWYYVTGSVWTTPKGPDDGGQCIAMRASAADITPCQRDSNLKLCSLAPELVEALLKALPFVEDCEDDTCYKKGVVKKAVKEIRELLDRVPKVEVVDL